MCHGGTRHLSGLFLDCPQDKPNRDAVKIQKVKSGLRGCSPEAEPGISPSKASRGEGITHGGGALERAERGARKGLRGVGGEAHRTKFRRELAKSSAPGGSWRAAELHNPPLLEVRFLALRTPCPPGWAEVCSKGWGWEGEAPPALLLGGAFLGGGTVRADSSQQREGAGPRQTKGSYFSWLVPRCCRVPTGPSRDRDVTPSSTCNRVCGLVGSEG